MGWNNPRNWAEVLQSVEAGFVFNTRGTLRLQGDSAHLVCGQYSTRATLSGHLDDFAHRIIESNDGLHKRYMKSDRWAAQRPDDVTYFVCRDGNALAYVTRAGDVVVNEQVERSAARYHNAAVRLMPALQAYARKRRERAVIQTGDEVFTPSGGVAQTVRRVGTDRWFVRFDNDDEDAYPTDKLKKVIDF